MNKVAKELWENRKKRGGTYLCRNQASSFLDDTLGFLFPQLHDRCYQDLDAFTEDLQKLEQKLLELLDCVGCGTKINLAREFLESLPGTQQSLWEDAQYILSGDPAASDVNEIIVCYPGFYAIAVYRIANHFFRAGVPLLPRFFTELAHSRTGIDIHPGATIGHPFFIDHGTGIVIGETTTIGNRVKIYQGVTLGALHVKKEHGGQKRHPTIEDGCLIYSNATILGGETVVGAESIVGGNVWLTKSVPPKSKVFEKNP